MNTHIITTYTFDELGPNARQKALDNNRGWNVEYFPWYEFTIDDLKENAPAGAHIDNIRFTGFWSQGDGASWEGAFDVAEWLKGNKLAGKYRALYNMAKLWEVKVSVNYVTSHYCHEGTAVTNKDDDYIYDYTIDDATMYRRERMLAQWEEVYKMMAKERLDICRNIYSTLQETFEYLTSDEAVKDALIANEVEFLENGRNYNL